MGIWWVENNLSKKGLFLKFVCLFQIVSLVLTVLVYPYSILIVNVERKYLLPSVPTRGHGLVLLVFWTLIFIAENLAFLNLGKNEWWFQLKRYRIVITKKK